MNIITMIQAFENRCIETMALEDDKDFEREYHRHVETMRRRIIKRYIALQAENARLRAGLEQVRAFLKPLEEGWNDDPDAGDILDALSPAHDA